jgi:hypothetical protein
MFVTIFRGFPFLSMSLVIWKKAHQAGPGLRNIPLGDQYADADRTAS